MPLNLRKSPLYWNYTFGFNFDHITAVCSRVDCNILSRLYCPRQENDVMSFLQRDAVHKRGLCRYAICSVCLSVSVCLSH